MSMNDPIADMLTRIRNAAQARHDQVVIPYSRVKEAIAKALSSEGFLLGVESVGEGATRSLVVTLKYTENRDPVFVDLRRISKPGRRVYQKHTEIEPMRQGAGISLYSTPKGMMKDVDAKKAGVGGELICTIW